MWIDVPISSISFVDHLEIPGNFAFDSLISLSLHLAFLIEFLTSLFYIVDRASDQLSLSIFGEPFVNEDILLV